MQSNGREPSMEDILASIKKVIAEEKGLRTSVRAADPEEYSDDEDDVLELNEPLAPSVDLGPPLVDEHAAGKSRQALEQLQTVAATVPPLPQGNPLEEIIREMLRPMLKQWLDEHVKREISRITGRPL